MCISLPLCCADVTVCVMGFGGWGVMVCAYEHVSN